MLGACIALGKLRPRLEERDDRLVESSTATRLFDGSDGDAGGAGHDKVAIFDARSDLVQHEGNDVRLDRQEEDVALAHRLFVAGGDVHA